MALPVEKRDFDVFLSHAHRDKGLVDFIDNLLSNVAGLKVWYDARELNGGSLLATDLQKAIIRCRGLLLVATSEAITKGWVKSEYNAAMDQRSQHENFRIVALRVDSANLEPMVMQGITWIDISSDVTQLSAEIFASIILAFHPGDKLPTPGRSKDVYVSCSWHLTDGISANTVIKNLIENGFRVIGDSVSQSDFQDDRVERIIESCGALVCVIPYRGVDSANASEKPYRYFLKELDIAIKLDIPHLVIADPRISRSDGDDVYWLRMETEGKNCSEQISARIEQLWSEWRHPSKPHYIFCAMDLDDKDASKTSVFRALIERITGMQTFIGTEIGGNPVNSAIMDKIRGAVLLIADITDDNLNTCIEAGMGLAVNIDVALISKGIMRRPPFMLRTLQLHPYSNDVEKIGRIYKIIWPYRRRVINAEV